MEKKISAYYMTVSVLYYSGMLFSDRALNVRVCQTFGGKGFLVRI